MRAPLSLLLLSICLLACTGARCSGESTAPKAEVVTPKPVKPRPDLRVLVLTDPKGYLEPCGCQQRPLGGVDKLAHIVAAERAANIPTLLVAAGDLTFGVMLSPEDMSSAATQEAWRAETLVKAWNEMGMSAVAPGKLDLVRPPAQLAKLIETSKFPWLIDNVSAPEKLPGIRQAQLLELDGIKVGLLGIVAPDPALSLPEGVVLAEALADTTERATKELRERGARVVVALVNGDRRASRLVGGAGPDVVVMGGLDVELPLPPTVHGRAVMVHAGRQGQRVVTLDLELDGEGEPHDASSWSLGERQKSLQQQIDELSGRIRDWEKASNVAKKDLDVQRQRLADLKTSREALSTVRYEGRWFDAVATELAPEVPGEREIAAALDAYDVRVNEHNRDNLAGRLPEPAPPGAAHYVGAEACRSCHQPAYAWWRQTKHGRAYATLEAVHKEFNLSCVGCHVTGYNQPGGSTVTHVEKLKDVGCETCHGPGSLHVASPDKPGLTMRNTPESVCAGCHTQEHSDRFDFQTFLPLLRAPGHGLPAAGKAP